MTLEELQSALERNKREEEEICGYDLCGNYARCDFCDRGEALPCANAYLRFRRSPSSAVPAWKLPEPDVGWEEPEGPIEEPKREEENTAENTAPAVLAAAPFEQEAREAEESGEAEETPSVSAEEEPGEEPAEEPAEEEKAERKKLLRRGQRGTVRLFAFRRSTK